jgi:hypothetical protein
MSDRVLTYAPARPRRPSRLATGAIWLAGAAHGLFGGTMIGYYGYAAPAYRAFSPSYHWKKYWLVVVPAWSAMAVAWVGVALAVVALLTPGRSRGRSAAALAANLALYVWMVVFG